MQPPFRFMDYEIASQGRARGVQGGDADADGALDVLAKGFPQPVRLPVFEAGQVKDPAGGLRKRPRPSASEDQPGSLHRRVGVREPLRHGVGARIGVLDDRQA